MSLVTFLTVTAAANLRIIKINNLKNINRNRNEKKMNVKNTFTVYACYATHSLKL